MHAQTHLAAVLELDLHDAVLDAVVARPLVAVGGGVQHRPVRGQLQLPPVVGDPVLLAAGGGQAPGRRRGALGGGGSAAASPAPPRLDGQAWPGGVTQAATKKKKNAKITNHEIRYIRTTECGFCDCRKKEGRSGNGRLIRNKLVFTTTAVPPPGTTCNYSQACSGLFRNLLLLFNTWVARKYWN